MQRKGVCYDVGRVMGVNWRPRFDPAVVHRELQIIRDDLHCSAVRICGQDIGRLTAASQDALALGLEVWLSAEMWGRGPERTLRYLIKAAAAAQTLHERWPGRVVFSVGSELTLFMRGIIEGRTFTKRLRNAFSGKAIRAGLHNKPLNEFLARASEAVRGVFGGPIAYAALIWEKVDWGRFEFVGVDHYWDERIKDRYVEMLEPLFEFGKPVVISEFGFPTCEGADSSGGVLRQPPVGLTFLLHHLPFVGRFVRPRVSKVFERDEGLQARLLVDQLRLLDGLGVDGAFVSTFAFPIFPYDEDPRHDLDRVSASLVKTFTGGRRGATYPDMEWEPKESFRAVAEYYSE